MMTRTLLLLLIGLVLPDAAHAASFDCARAGTAAEKRICADARLSRDDEALAAGYAVALAATPLPAELRADQRDWIAGQRDKAPTDAAMHDAIVARLAELAARAKADALAARPVPLADIARRCIATRADQPNCSVEHAGRIAAQGLAWQVRAYHDGALRTGSGITVFAVGGTTARPIVWREEEDGWLDEPAIVQSPAGTLLDLGGHMDGTGNFSIETLLLRDGPAWRELDLGAIEAGLTAAVPRGLGIWKGVYPDWRHMTVETPLWKRGDGNCCPTGGSVHGTLRRAGLRILVAEAHYDRTPIE